MPKLTWLFDLDNTLHNASHAIFPAMHLNMSAYIAKVLQQSGLASDAAAVDAARVGYWQRYGATLLGMVNHHQVRPCLLYTSPSPRDQRGSRMPSSA